MEFVQTMSEQVTEKFENSLATDANRKVFPAIAHMPNLQHLYSPSPTKSHDSGVSLNKSTPQNEFDRLPRLVELSSQASRSEFRRELTTVRTARLPKQMSSIRRKTEAMARMSPADDCDKSDTANQFNPDPMPYQARNFRSSTMIRNVPLSRRHQESFSHSGASAGPTLVKTKTVPFHTKPFLWDPLQRMHTSLVIEPSQRNKFKDEEGYLEEVRGLKRKREVIQHRIQYTDLSIDGLKPNMHEKMDYADELEKLKSVPFLPKECQELYHGRGIKLPPSHSSNRKPPEPKFVLPPPLLPPAPITKTKTFTEQVDVPIHDDRDRELKVQPPAKMKRQSTNIKKKEKRKNSTTSNGDQSQPSSREKNDPKTQMEKVDQATQETRVEITVDEQEHDMETEEKPQTPPPDDRPESEMDIEVPAIDEPDNLLKPGAPSITPAKSVSPNPLKSVDLSLHVSDARREELTRIFKKLDSDKDGHITFPELCSQLSEHLTKSQQKYLKQVYEITSAATFFGLEEFMTVMCLSESMVNLDPIQKATYEQLDFTALEHTIVQFVELYSSVDRRQSGSISVESLQGILSTAFDKDISDRKFTVLLQEIHKDTNSTIDKVEFLAYIPYFQTYK